MARRAAGRSRPPSPRRSPGRRAAGPRSSRPASRAWRAATAARLPPALSPPTATGPPRLQRPAHRRVGVLDRRPDTGARAPAGSRPTRTSSPPALASERQTRSKPSRSPMHQPPPCSQTSRPGARGPPCGRVDARRRRCASLARDDDVVDGVDGLHRAAALQRGLQVAGALAPRGRAGPRRRRVGELGVEQRLDLRMERGAGVTRRRASRSRWRPRRARRSALPVKPTSRCSSAGLPCVT